MSFQHRMYNCGEKKNVSSFPRCEFRVREGKQRRATVKEIFLLEFASA